MIRSRTKKTTQKLAELGIEIPVLDILNQVPKKRPAKEEKSGEVEAPEPAKKQKLETDDSVKPKKQKLEKRVNWFYLCFYFIFTCLPG